jgi:hypothetical protein
MIRFSKEVASAQKMHTNASFWTTQKCWRRTVQLKTRKSTSRTCESGGVRAILLSTSYVPSSANFPAQQQTKGERIYSYNVEELCNRHQYAAEGAFIQSFEILYYLMILCMIQGAVQQCKQQHTSQSLQRVLLCNACLVQHVPLSLHAIIHHQMIL